MAVILSRKSGGSSGSGGAPSGAAGGDLTGTYPNPTIGAGKVTAAQVAADVATQAELDAVATASVAKAIVDAKGDLIVATAADTVARKAVGATNGMHLEAQSGQADGLLWSLPPGYEFSYVEAPSPVSVTATTEAAATTVVTAGAVTFDGSTRVKIEFYAVALIPGATAASAIYVLLYDGSSSIGYIWETSKDTSSTANVSFSGCYAARFLTPSAAAHTYSIRAYRGVSNGTINAGAGGAANDTPAFIRITKA